MSIWSLCSDDLALMQMKIDELLIAAERAQRDRVADAVFVDCDYLSDEEVCLFNCFTPLTVTNSDR